MQNTSLPTRNEIQEKYKWDLTLIYKTENLWNEDFEFLSNEIEKVTTYKGTMGNSASNMLEFFKFTEKLDSIFEKLYLYAFLSRDEEMSNGEANSRYGSIQGLLAKYGALCSFITPELNTIAKEKIAEFMENEDGLKIYNHFFDNLWRQKEHSLSQAEERILALTSPLMQAPSQIFSALKNSDIIHHIIQDENDNDTEMSDGRFYAALYSQDRNYRERAYSAYYTPIIQHKNSLAQLFNNGIKAFTINAEIRGYESSLEAALKPNNIPIDVFHNLVESVNNGLHLQHRWAAIKSKMLGVEKINMFDTYVSIFPAPEKKYSYEEGCSLVLNSLQVMGKEYTEAVELAINNRRIDVMETKNKRSGAYSSGTTFGVEPYILLNWNGTLNDVSTLTHEIGHNMHSYFTGLKQHQVYAGYPIFLAEVASILNEALLHNYLLQSSEDIDFKRFLIEMQLNKYVTTFYRQTQFAEYELWAHTEIQKGRFLSHEELSAKYREICQKYWGDKVHIDDEETYTWARVPHFYYGFYVYQYATGLAAADYLAKQILEQGQPAVNRVLAFLQAGKSDYAINILKAAGVDMSNPEPINATLENMKINLDLLENLL